MEIDVDKEKLMKARNEMFLSKEHLVTSCRALSESGEMFESTTNEIKKVIGDLVCAIAIIDDELKS